MLGRQRAHALPRPTTATALAASAERAEPVASYLADEAGQAVAVAGDGMIIQPALNNPSQPTARFAYWAVHPLLQPDFDRLEGRAHALGHTVAMNREPAVLASLGALVREAKEIESFRPALAAPLVDRPQSDRNESDAFSLRAASSRTWRSGRGVPPCTPWPRPDAESRSQSHPHNAQPPRRRGSGCCATTRSRGQRHNAGTRLTRAVRSPPPEALLPSFWTTRLLR